MKIVKVLEYGHDNCIIIEDTQNAMDWKYRARMRDGGALGCGNRPYDAVTSLLINMTNEANDIRQALCNILFKEKGWM